MPKYIGRDMPLGHDSVTELPPNYDPSNDTTRSLVRLQYRQACLMQSGTVYRSLDTTDRGGRRVPAKRWYRWFATRDAIVACPRSTPAMLRRAAAAAATTQPSTYEDWSAAVAAAVADAVAAGREWASRE
jgi:hypothetical protein